MHDKQKKTPVNWAAVRAIAAIAGALFNLVRLMLERD